MVNRVNLPETGYVPLFGGVEGAYRDTAFQEIQGFAQTFPFQLEGFLVFLEIPVYGRGTYCFQFFHDFVRYVKCRPRGNVLHLPPRQRREDFPAFVPEECPYQPEGGDDLIGIDSFSHAGCGPLLFRLEPDRLAVSVDQDFPDQLVA
jgi:hypothetical protein